MECSLEEEDLIIPDICPVLGIPLISFKEGHATANSLSIDRRDNSRGYTKENCSIISMKANMCKGNLSIQDVENLLKYMKGEI